MARRPQPIVTRQRIAGLIEAAELHPRVAGALLVATTHQEIPFHALVPVAVGLDARCARLTVEQERQRQRQHLRLARAVVAAQQQMSVAETELFNVVVIELDEPQTQRLPACACRLG